MLSCRSFIVSKKRSKPRTDAWGNTHVTVPRSMIFLLAQLPGLDPPEKNLIQFRILPLMPWCDFFIKRLKLTYHATCFLHITMYKGICITITHFCIRTCCQWLFSVAFIRQTSLSAMCINDKHTFSDTLPGAHMFVRQSRFTFLVF